MNIFGLDIGSTSIKVAQVIKEKDKYRFLAAGITPSPRPGLMSEAEADLLTVAEVLKKLHKDAQITTDKVVCALPEGEVFTRMIQMPPMSNDELGQAIHWEAEKFIPRPLTEVTLDWRVISKEKESDKMDVFLVAAPNRLIEKFNRVCQLAQFEVVGIETEIIATARALIDLNSPPVLLLELGAKTTDFAIVNKGQLMMTRSIPTAGEAFTRAISTSLALELRQAEEYKRAYGLQEGELEGKIKAVLDPFLEIIVNEVRKGLAFWQEKEKLPVGSVILSGGTASLPELATELAKTLGLEVQIANPFDTLIMNEKTKENLKGNACLFSVAIGLAKKEF